MLFCSFDPFFHVELPQDTLYNSKTKELEETRAKNTVYVIPVPSWTEIEWIERRQKVLKDYATHCSAFYRNPYPLCPLR